MAVKIREKPKRSDVKEIGEWRYLDLQNGRIEISDRLEGLLMDVISNIPEKQWQEIARKRLYILQSPGRVRKWRGDSKRMKIDYEMSFSSELENNETFARYIIAHEFPSVPI